MWGSFLYAGISLPPRRQKANFVEGINAKNPINPKISITLKPQAAPPFYKLCHNVAGQLFYNFKGHFAMPLFLVINSNFLQTPPLQSSHKAEKPFVFLTVLYLHTTAISFWLHHLCNSLHFENSR